MRKPALRSLAALIAATTVWTGVTAFTAPQPQPVLPVAYVNPQAQLDPSTVTDLRDGETDPYAAYCFDAALAEGEYLDDRDDVAASLRCAAQHITVIADSVRQRPCAVTAANGRDTVWLTPADAAWQRCEVTAIAYAEV